ncbi:MAG: DUF5801 repeats-in-toxin domain-containing protein, partial [Erythrobacter sp.]
TTTAPFADQFAVLADGKVALTASATITDGDGDSASDSASIDLGGNIRFADDGPAVTLAGTAPVLEVDESDLSANASASFAANFVAAFGADGAATGGGLAYTLGVVAGASGLVDTASGQNVVLSLTGAGVVEGRTAGSDVLVFTVTVDATGTVTLDQLRAVRHPDASDPDDAVTLSAANLITLTATATDFDGDTASATLNIATSLVFRDDAGDLGAFQGATIPNAIGSVLGTFMYSPGADGHGSFTITGPDIPGITYSTVQNANGALLTATAISNGNPVTVFTLQVNTDGTYEFSLVTPDAGTTETVSLLGLTAGGPQAFVETPDFKIEFSSDTGGINSSTQGFGIDNQRIRDGESFTMEFYNPGRAGNDIPTDPTANADFIDALAFTVDSVNGGDVLFRWTARNTETGQTDTGTFTVNSAGVFSIDPAISFNVIDIVAIGGSASAGQGARFTSVAVTRSILPNDLALEFDISAVDGDGDPTVTQTLSVFVDAHNTIIPPIALDLDGDGQISFLGLEAGIAFDYNGDGSPIQTAWVGPQDGLLARYTEDGRYDIVFTDDAPGAKTDLEGLAMAYDSNGDGLFTIADDAFASFGIWQDANSNGKVDEGEFTYLADAGVTVINLSSDGQSYNAANGDVIVFGTGSFTINGTTQVLADAGFAVGGPMGSNTLMQASKVELRSQDGMVSAAAMAGFLAVMPIALAVPVEMALASPPSLQAEGLAVATEMVAARTASDAPLAKETAWSDVASDNMADKAQDSIASGWERVDAPASPFDNANGLLETAAVDPWSAGNAPEVVSPLFAGADLNAAGMMEALLLQGTGPAADIAQGGVPFGEMAQDVMADVVAGSMIDELLEVMTTSVPENDAGQTQGDASYLTGLLSQDISGQNLTVQAFAYEISVDETAQMAVAVG